MQSIVLVDYESVGNATLAKILQLAPKYQRILLLIGAEQHAQDAAAAFITKALAADKRVDLIKMSETSKNNLDLHLAFYLGKTLAEEPNAEYVIFTKDKTDFDPLVNHLKNRGIKCSRKEFTDKPAEKPSSTPTNVPAKAAVKQPAPKTAAQEKKVKPKALIKDALKKLKEAAALPDTWNKLRGFLEKSLKLPPDIAGQVLHEMEKQKIFVRKDKGRLTYGKELVRDVITPATAI